MSVTAWPVILVDSATGSDSAASGAGPSTALTGTTAVSTGTTVVLDAGTVLTNVNTDGSHVLYFADATAGNRNFTAINGKSGSGGATPTITVEQTLASTTKSWAIGGKRASVFGSVSRKLIDNNGSAGDMVGGWIIEMQSGHTETTGSQIDLRAAGDTTGGAVILRGKPGAATMPIVTYSGGGLFIAPRVAGWRIETFELQATSGGSVKWASAPVSIVCKGLKCEDATNHFTDGFYLVDGDSVLGCGIGYITNTGVLMPQNGGTVFGNKIHHCGGVGAQGTSNEGIGNDISDNVIVSNGSHGITIGGSSNVSPNRRTLILGNTLADNAGDGILNSATDSAAYNTPIVNNILSGNGGYGINYTGSGVTLAYLMSQGYGNAGNDTHGNSSGASNIAGLMPDDPGLDPSYVGGGNYTPTNTSLKGTAYPTTLGGATNYLYPGAIQPNSGGGSAGMLYVPGMAGGVDG